MDRATAAVVAASLLAIACYVAISFGLPVDIPFNP